MVKLSIITSLEQRKSMLRREHLIADIASFREQNCLQFTKTSFERLLQ